MLNPGRTRQQPKVWVGTARACELLDISRWTLTRARDGKQLRKGYHWKVVNPKAAKLRYLWHVERLEQWQQGVSQ